MKVTATVLQIDNGPALDSDAIRQAVTDELSQPRYQATESFWSRFLALLERWWVRFVEWVAAVSETIGGPLVAGLIALGVVLAVAVVISYNLGRRRTRTVEQRLRSEYELARGLDPDELERQAATAESEGDLTQAFRLLFRAGLVRLDRTGAIDLRPGTTAGSASEQIGAIAFTELVGRFDAVVYGDRPASGDDLVNTRRIFSGLLADRRVTT